MFVIAGCGKQEITSYNIPKGSESAIRMAAAPMADESGSAQMAFKTPEGWQQETPTGMNLAQFSIGGHQAELSVLSFPGEGASQLNIINIVRQNAGLSQLTQKELASLVEDVSIGKEKGSLVNLSAATTNSASIKSSNSVTVAVFPHNGTTYFFKLAGNTSVVEAQRTPLLEFLKSVSFPGGSPNSTETLPPMAVAQTPQTDSETPTQIAHEPGLPAWDVPTGWKEVPPTEMLLAKFVVKKSDGAVDVTISSFPGDVGGALANVNRWRGMVKLPSINSADLEKSTGSLEVMGGKAMLVDVEGSGAKTGKATRLVGVIWPRNGQTWFYKMMGDSAAVGSEKAAFAKFVHSVRYAQ